MKKPAIDAASYRPRGMIALTFQRCPCAVLVFDISDDDAAFAATLANRRSIIERVPHVSDRGLTLSVTCAAAGGIMNLQRV